MGLGARERRRADSNCRMEVLQTSALPLGYGAKTKGGDGRHFTGSPPRAGNGTRTRDPNLGKVVLYQLSYSRMGLECP